MTWYKGPSGDRSMIPKVKDDEPSELGPDYVADEDEEIPEEFDDEFDPDEEFEPEGPEEDGPDYEDTGDEEGSEE